jgi:predicted phage terminase large subunit-like protein
MARYFGFVCMNIDAVIAKIMELPVNEQEAFFSELAEYENSVKREKAQIDFASFVKDMWPGFIDGRHHKVMGKKFQEIADGKLKRLIINMPPRHTKSEFASFLLPAWFLGKFPGKKIIQTSNTAELAVGFGRKVRNLVDSEQYAKIFPNVNLRSDSKAAGRWATNAGGEYFAIGVGGTVTGKGADLLIIDDPHSEQEAALAATSPEIFDKVYEWYTSGPRQRLQPGGSIIVVMTRWSKKDLTGKILQSMIDKDGEHWEVISFPAILPSGNPLWPEFWSLPELEALRLELPAGKWNAQYQQEPTSEEGAIIKREWWKLWEPDKPPRCEFIIQSWDTAFTKSERADYSACTTWGVFYKDENENDPNVILLDAFKKRMEFPELKEKAFNYYKEWEPDAFVVEAKASGAPLIYELRAMGIPVQEFTPSRGNDKMVRINSVSDLFASGKVWAPATRWADELIEEMAAFPNSDHDDLVDSSTQALIRFRKGGFLRLQTDEEDEPLRFRRKMAYY